MDKTLRMMQVIAITAICMAMLAGCGKTEEITEVTLETTATIVEETTKPVTIPTEDGCEGVEPLDFSEPTVETSEEVEESGSKETVATEISEGTAAKATETTEPIDLITPTENEKTTEPTESSGPCCEYDKYMAMSPSEQEAYMRSFSDPMAFISWSQTAEAEHKAHDDTINVEGGDLDIGDYME